VAWHLQAFGLNPLFISKVGSDLRGKNILAAMQKWQLSTGGIFVDQAYPTGTVSITRENGEPVFNILDRQAYDQIGYHSVCNVTNPQTHPLLYYGTLITRHRTSADTLEKIKQNYTGIVFVDINLRKPWWNRQLVLSALNQAGWLKCNDSEFRIIQSFLSLDSESENQTALKLIAQFNLQAIIITSGVKGACIYTRRDEKLIARPPAGSPVLDTVGAGDALSAVIILGILKKWDLSLTLQRGVNFAAQICGIIGAVPEHIKFYTPFLHEWNL
jgi:fructokinase